MSKRNRKDVVPPGNKHMVCVVPKQNVEVLGRALHALARIGEELYVEPVDGGLTFRTVHSNHSVYAEVHFTDQFFSYYNNLVPERNSDDDNDELKCRINMKSYLAAFRSLPCLRKQVETCLLQIEPTWLIVKFRCHHGLIRTYRLPVIESETLHALYTIDEVPNNLVIDADVFSASVKNFQFSERDITLAVEQRLAILRNYVPGSTDPSGVVRSELKLDAGEFNSFSVGQETAITFCLKAFRAVLYFSEPVNLPLAVKFSSPGNPVVIMSSSPTYEIRFVLSSLAPEDCDGSRNESQQLMTPLRSLEDRAKHQGKKQHQKGRSNSSTLSEAWEESSEKADSRSKQNPAKGKNINSAPSRPRPSLDVDVSVCNPGPSTSHQARGKPSVARSLQLTSQDSASSAASSTRAVVGSATETDSEMEAVRGVQWNSKNANASVVHSKVNGVHKRDTVIPCSEPEDEGDGDNDVLPATPPPPTNKRARFFFQRCFEPTLNSESLLSTDNILAYDSDEG